jgi:hypothetical protein
MADENDRIEVDITPDAPPLVKMDDEIVIIDEDSDKVQEEQVAEPEDDDSDPLKAIEKLKKKLKKEKEARREAEEKARQAAFHAQKASLEVEDTNRHLVNNAIETIKRDNEILAANYAEAMRNGDYETGARIQSIINKNDLNLEKLESGQIKMEQEAKTRPPVVDEPPAPLKPKEMVDNIISQVSKQSAQWLRENREHLESDRAIKKMFNAHGEAVDDGIEPDTPEYFRYIEKRLGINQDDNGGSPMSSASKPAPRQAPPPSAPVNRDNGGRNNVGHLTRAQADTAKALGMTDKEYYLHMVALQKEGRLSH